MPNVVPDEDYSIYNINKKTKHFRFFIPPNTWVKNESI